MGNYLAYLATLLGKSCFPHAC
uniref:Uncharacterized protein n=1 Tax=Anguilla anguilla TaxID=7936 RepID=A0A0E9PI22_ANGAN